MSKNDDLIQRIRTATDEVQHIWIAVWFCEKGRWIRNIGAFEDVSVQMVVFETMITGLLDRVDNAKQAYDPEVAFAIRVHGSAQPVSAHDRMIGFGEAVLWRVDRWTKKIKDALGWKEIPEDKITTYLHLLDEGTTQAKNDFAPSTEFLIKEMETERDRAIFALGAAPHQSRQSSPRIVKPAKKNPGSKLKSLVTDRFNFWVEREAERPGITDDETAIEWMRKYPDRPSKGKDFQNAKRLRMERTDEREFPPKNS